MEKKLGKYCSINEFQVGLKYRCHVSSFYVTHIDYDLGRVFVTWCKSKIEGLIYLGTNFYAYEVPLSSLEKELW
jgi:hypothetical protein